MRAVGVRVHFDDGLAVVVQREFGQLAERAARVIGHVAEDEAGPLLRQGNTVALDLEGRQQAVAGGGRAVQVIALHIDRQLVVGAQHLLFRIERHLHALGQEFLDLNFHEASGARDAGSTRSSSSQVPVWASGGRSMARST